jgi:hypothetical protein
MGCAQPEFYQDMSPLYTAESEISKRILAMKGAGLFKRENS